MFIPENGGTAVPPSDEARPEDQTEQLTVRNEEADEDLDARELREAMEAAKAEQAGQDGEPGDDPDDKGQQPADKGGNKAEGDRPEQRGAAEPGPGPVPYARFREVINDRGKMAAEISRMRGKIEAYERGQGQPAREQEQQPPQPSAEEQRLNKIDEEILGLAKKFDEGELSAEQWRKQDWELQKEAGLLNDQIAAARAPKPQRQEPPPPPGDSAYLTERTAEFARQSPRLDQMSERHFNQLETDVRNWFAEQNVSLKGEAGTLRLRQAMAANAEAMEQIYLQRDDALSGRRAPAQQPEQPTRPTPEQRQQKHALRDGMPPDLDNVPGTSVGGNQAITEADIDGMTDEEINALPAPVRQKYLGMGA